LTAVDFTVRPAEVHVVVGENGAGKSTLIKILAGAYHPDRGEVLVHGAAVAWDGPRDALAAGIATVYQEFTLIPHMTVTRNIMLGQEPTRWGFMDDAEINRRAESLIHELDVDLNPQMIVSDLRVAYRQLVEILKALAVPNVKVLILDEPTAALSKREIEILFGVLRRLRERGVGIVYISHRLEEVHAIGDVVTVLRDGHVVAHRAVSDIDTDSMIELMIGRPATQIFPPRKVDIGPAVLRVERLTLADGRANDVSFEVRRGEVVGCFGLVGAGRTELARGLFGLHKVRGGVIEVDGRAVRVSSPKRGFRLGLGLAPEDRKQDGIVAAMSVSQNINLSSLRKAMRGPFLSPARMEQRASEYIREMRIATPNPATEISSLSGGNQQKCILSRLLAADVDILLLDEPTRGIDVGAKAEVYRLINGLAASGKAILMISSDLLEIIGMSDRVVVFRQGRVAATFDREHATEGAIMRVAVPARLESDDVDAPAPAQSGPLA
jgi:ribose transport system ATP-binding protein